jgi:hypothetical protein
MIRVVVGMAGRGGVMMSGRVGQGLRMEMCKCLRRHSSHIDNRTSSVFSYKHEIPCTYQ